MVINAIAASKRGLVYLIRHNKHNWLFSNAFAPSATMSRRAEAHRLLVKARRGRPPAKAPTQVPRPEAAAASLMRPSRRCARGRLRPRRHHGAERTPAPSCGRGPSRGRERHDDRAAADSKQTCQEAHTTPPSSGTTSYRSSPWCGPPRRWRRGSGCGGHDGATASMKAPRRARARRARAAAARAPAAAVSAPVAATAAAAFTPTAPPAA